MHLSSLLMLNTNICTQCKERTIFAELMGVEFSQRIDMHYNVIMVFVFHIARTLLFLHIAADIPNTMFLL